ncbi:hypothetical protein B7P43_G09992 [Cryptotermes secundus]|uniref:Uncharacterized protein n=1 Tax=Cryptotermes secundus TaxID=105785 RepID=A0A2J7RH17_9NEOP|nr:hypothetical protein B7P43_G09992 [Cryptotermes secundus]
MLHLKQYKYDCLHKHSNRSHAFHKMRLSNKNVSVTYKTISGSARTLVSTETQEKPPKKEKNTIRRVNLTEYFQCRTFT